jgi:hypothetical protein
MIHLLKTCNREDLPIIESYLDEYVGEPQTAWFWAIDTYGDMSDIFIWFKHEEDALAFKLKFGL